MSILKQAKALIEKHGWIQHEYGDEEKGFCAIGAISHAANLIDSPSRASFEYYEAVAQLERQLAARYGYSYVARFNDRISTTKQDILDLFDAAIAAEES